MRRNWDELEEQNEGVRREKGRGQGILQKLGIKNFNRRRMEWNRKNENCKEDKDRKQYLGKNQTRRLKKEKRRIIEYNTKAGRQTTLIVELHEKNGTKQESKIERKTRKVKIEAFRGKWGNGIKEREGRK